MKKFVGTLLLLFLVFQVGNCQYEAEDYDEEESEGEVEVASTSTRKIDNDLKMNFTEQFASLTSQVDNAGNGNGTKLNSTSTSSKAPTKRPSPPKTKATTELSRGQQIGQGVNGILNSVGTLNIPGIVDMALSIRDPEEDDGVREFVAGIMTTIFCAPVLNLFSNCGDRLGVLGLGGGNANNKKRTRPKNKPKNETEATTVPPHPALRRRRWAE